MLTYSNLSNLGFGRVEYVYRDGRPIAYRFDDNGCGWRLVAKPHDRVRLTEVQAYRYWFRHFKSRHIDYLPTALRNAIYGVE